MGVQIIALNALDRHPWCMKHMPAAEMSLSLSLSLSLALLNHLSQKCHLSIELNDCLLCATICSALV